MSYQMAVNPLSWAQVDNKADAARKEFFPAGTSLILDVYAFMEFEMEDALGFSLEAAQLPIVDEGYTDFSRNMIFLSERTHAGLAAGIPRARYTAAHELGHVILHRRQMTNLTTQHTVCLHRTGDIPPFRNPERQANRFAATLLMPTEKVVEVADRYQNNASRCAQVFGVSRESMFWRLKNLGRQPV